MDWLDVLILGLRLALVAVLYVFLWLVLRLAMRGLQAPRRSLQQLRLVVLEAGGSSFTPGQVIDVFDGAVLGRTAHAEVIVGDPAVSSAHARVSRIGDAWVVTDLGSTNGTRVNESAVDGQTPVAQGDVLALGTVRLRVVTH